MPYDKPPINYFEEYPWPCKCGCKLDNMDLLFIHALNAARHRAGVPFVITSACRCPDYNMVQGGAYTSDHLTGQGVDISSPTSQMRFKIVEALLYVGINRIGIGPDFIHAGGRMDNPQNVIWLY